MAMAGSLSEVGLADICQLLSLGRKTGRLTVTNRGDLGYLYFDQGRITYASVLNRPDRLGELLVLNAVIDRAQLEEAMDYQAGARGERLGTVLISQGAISEDELAHFIRIQIEEAAFHLFTWTEGTFRFEADAVPEATGIFLISASAEGLLLEGARRVDEWELIRKKIPSNDLVFRIDREPGSGDDVELTVAQKRIIPLVDGKASVRDLVVQSGLVEFEAVKALFGLIQAGFARPVPKPAQGGAGASSGGGDAEPLIDLGIAFYRTSMLDDAERELTAAVEQAPQATRAHFWLGVIALRRSQPNDALARFVTIEDIGRASFALHMNRALAYEMLEEWDKALLSLDDAEEIRPENAGVLLARGIVQLQSGNAKAARAALVRYRQALGADDPDPIWYALAPLASLASGEAGEARDLGEEALDRFPDHPVILVNVGHLLERLGSTTEAESLYLRAVSGSDPPAQAHKNLGNRAHERGDLAGARAHFERAIRIDPRLGDDVYQRLGDIVYREKDLEWAGVLWGRALELNPANQVVRTNLELLSTAAGQ